MRFPCETALASPNVDDWWVIAGRPLPPVHLDRRAAQGPGRQHRAYHRQRCRDDGSYRRTAVVLLHSALPPVALAFGSAELPALCSDAVEHRLHG
eukprot:CAMPEP_0206472456 /NCGR_PEP_ID=MMETSP0324_2-20121206/32212_1 /ASSEMBLY_ACC=CAM_ASM_000836 /TAXON_ID=2866 /ORGANISM="Crypthecodinium cohnii, Strain Seligo" /LENGTH=94 /DNA_ID=CAMNT_0053947061 /DNA_START=313 /DNA_END=594 /DNA_ORIENTATION=+